MGKVKWFKPLGNMVMPSLLFYVAYHVWGIIPAMILSLAYGILSLTRAKFRHGTVKNSQIIGILGLVSSAVMILFTGEEKLYYIPAVIQNMIFLGFLIVLSVQRKSILHFLAKDFVLESLKQVPEKNLLSINVVWLIYFVLKILSKIVGILYLDFHTLYWVVFLLGDPMTILVVVLSIILVRMRCLKENRGLGGRQE